MLRYKYVPFTENSLKILTDGTIKFSLPSKVNDPFDCFPAHKVELDMRKYEIFIKTRPDLKQTHFQ
jgi:hypothetical protein